MRCSRALPASTICGSSRWPRSWQLVVLPGERLERVEQRRGREDEDLVADEVARGLVRLVDVVAHAAAAGLHDAVAARIPGLDLLGHHRDVCARLSGARRPARRSRACRPRPRSPRRAPAARTRGSSGHWSARPRRFPTGSPPAPRRPPLGCSTISPPAVRSRSHARPLARWSESECGLYCWATQTSPSPALKQLESGKSISRWVPAKETAGLARRWVSSSRRPPAPPARTRTRVRIRGMRTACPASRRIRRARYAA